MPLSLVSSQRSSRPFVGQGHLMLCGPQLTSKLFQDFVKEWGFCHVISTPTYPKSNWKIEATVKSMKKLIEVSRIRSRLDKGRLARALFQYWNTPPCRDNLSPAQKLFGHPVQDTLPAHRRAFAPESQRRDRCPYCVSSRVH